MKNHEDVLAIVGSPEEKYPEGLCSLQYPKPYELLFSVRLAAQCTDERVNMVTPALFARFPTLGVSAEGRPPPEVETYIHSTGFFRAKARDIVAASPAGGGSQYLAAGCPATMEELPSCPVWSAPQDRQPDFGRRVPHPRRWWRTPTAYALPAGLGLTDGTKDPAKVEEQLRPILPPEESDDFCHRMVLHGRAVCTARKPDCPNCTLRPWCDFYTKS